VFVICLQLAAYGFQLFWRTARSDQREALSSPTSSFQLFFLSFAMRFFNLFILTLSLAFQAGAQMKTVADLHPAASADSVWLMGPDKSTMEFSRFVEQNKGKVIYLDIWASWCRPCTGEMPASLALRKKLPDSSVVFLYISLDDNFASWQKAAQYFGLQNSFLLTNARESSLVRNLQLNSIPRYVVIGKNGKIVNRDASRPSEPKTYDYLLKLAQKKS
jgi:thiol-disulfide isomerase/thioredoxin